MHKDFYASGFLYHIATERILLQKRATTIPPVWSLLGGVNKRGETEHDAFMRIVETSLGTPVKPTVIYPIYTYFNKDIGKDYRIFYAEVPNLVEFSPVKDIEFSWFSRKQILKLNLDEQTRQDIMIGQRVIDGKERLLLGMRSIE